MSEAVCLAACSTVLNTNGATAGNSALFTNKTSLFINVTSENSALFINMFHILSALFINMPSVNNSLFVNVSFKTMCAYKRDLCA